MYSWNDNPTETGAIVDPDKLNADIMHLKYDVNDTWQPLTTYSAGKCSLPPAPNGFIYECTTGGTTGASEPTWATTIGQTVNDGTVVWTCRSKAGSGGASIGTGNYIAEPFAVTPGTGLEVSVAANRCVIDETVCESTTATTVALTAKAAQLIYKKKDNTYDKQLPKMTAADLVDANTVGLWFPDGSASVPNAAVGVNGNALAVANALTKSGTITAADGWDGRDAAKGDGASGYYTAANAIGHPTGTADRELIWFGKINSVSITECLTGYGNAAGSLSEWTIANISGALKVMYGGGSWDTSYQLEATKEYLIHARMTSAQVVSVAVNGSVVYSAQTSGIVTGAVSVSIGRRPNYADAYSSATWFFVGLRNALSTPAQIATLAQKLLIPCAYGATDIRDSFTNKAESQAVAFVYASATAPTTIIAPSDPKGATPDWAYGIRVGPMGALNKIKRLGKQSFSGTSIKDWDDPFGSRNLTLDAEWSLDSTGTNSSQIPNDAANSYPSILVNGKIRETITTGVYVAGSQKTSGYVDMIAEVID